MLNRAINRLRDKLHPRRISKAIGAVLGGVTGMTVTQIADEWLDLTITEPYAGAIAVALTALGAYLAPANRDVQTRKRKSAPPRTDAPTVT